MEDESHEGFEQKKKQKNKKQKQKQKTKNMTGDRVAIELAPLRG